jgi:hypothetical protein
MGVRWYDGRIGRWVSPDSIIPDPANPQSLNRYSYVYNNALRHTDPDGHGCVAINGDEYCSADIPDADALNAAPMDPSVGSPELPSVIGSVSAATTPLVNPLSGFASIGGAVSAAAALAPWVVAAGTAVGITAVSVAGLNDSTMALPIYGQPLPPDGGLGLSTAINTTVMSEYGLALISEGTTEIQDILHRMSRKRRGTGADAQPQPQTNQKLRQRVDGPPPLRGGPDRMPRLPGPPKNPRPEDLAGRIAYAMYVIARLGAFADQVGIDNLLGMDWPFKED